MRSPTTTPAIMLTVSAALMPAFIQSIAETGWIMLIQIIWSCLCCLVIEAIFAYASKISINKSVFNFTWLVTGLIIAKSLPIFSPAIYFLIASLIAIGIVKFGSGGLGKNKINPAMGGLAVVAICFYQQIHTAGELCINASEVVSLKETLEYFFSLNGYVDTDAVASATPLTRNWHGPIAHSYTWIGFLFGGILLYITKVIRIEIPLAIFAAYLFTECLFGQPLSTGLARLSLGGLIFAAFFIATDPVSSPLTRHGRIVYGLTIGAVVALSRNNGLYPDGIVFAILTGNLLTPHIDRWIWKIHRNNNHLR